MDINDFSIFKQFRQIIVWGFPLHSHTHSYIHGAWVKTFKHLGFQAYWFHDKEYPKDFDYSNSCFITEGWADDNIPVNASSTYFVHIAKNPAKYLDAGARLIEIRYNVLEIQDFNYSYKLPENPVYLSADTLYERLEDDSAVAGRRGRQPKKQPYEAVYMYWATDLLPHEIRYEDAEVIRESNIIHYIGSMGSNHPFFTFQRTAQTLGYQVIHHDPWSRPVSYEENIRLMKESYCAPDFRSHGDTDKRAQYGIMNGTNHLDIGYMPCRVLKAISYGQNGITNSKRVKEILGEFVEYAETPMDVFEISERRKNDIAWRKRCMKHIAENHTFLQRARDLGRALQMKSSKATCVTAMYDIGRASVDGRTIEQYKSWMLDTMRTIREPFVFFLDKSLCWKKEILEARSSVAPTQIYETSLAEIPMWKYRDRVSEILQDPTFKTRQKYPNDITNKLPEYCLIQYSKFDWIQKAIEDNQFNSSSFIWIDSGFSKLYNTTCSYQSTDSLPNGFIAQSDTTKSRIPSLTYDNYIGTNERIFQGGLWATDASTLPIIRKEVVRIWEEEMLTKVRLDNEQIALVLAYKVVPDSFILVPSSGSVPSLFGFLFT